MICVPGRAFHAFDSAAPRIQVADNVAHVLLGQHDFNSS
jgi:hypothetical protein